MNISKIKNLVKQNGDKFILVENGEPEIVMMSFGEYQRLVMHNANEENRGANAANKERYRPELTGWGDEGLPETEFIAPVAMETSGLPIRLEDIRLEDLPI